MSVYVIENIGGQFAHVGPVVFEWTSYTCASVFVDKQTAEKYATDEDKIVPLIPETESKAQPQAEPEEVEKYEAKFLSSLSEKEYPIDYFITLTVGDRSKQLHWFRALTNGWKIKPASRYFLPMDGTQVRQNDGLHQSYAFIRHGVWTTGILPAPASNVSSKHKYNYTVTDDEIAKAPSWVQGLEKVELEHVGL